MRLDDEALASIDAALAQGRDLAEVLTEAGLTATNRHGAVVIDETAGADRDDMAASLRLLAQVMAPNQRSFAVLGSFDSTPADSLEEHDYIGRLVVRLNIDQLVAIGHDARHIQSAAGLEGSWDGESLIVDSPEEAYDLLREQIRENDVVLVKAAASANLGPLAARLSGATR